ncbi:efflux RND transporter permease subunit, partial [Escherichia coli]|nr:efflux RND transporter permease subunit [Escherichia coli]
MGSCAAPSAKGDDKFITTDYLQQCLLIVPMTMLSALFGVWLTGGDNNVFVQVGLVVLMGLACKNAIL